MVSENYIRGQEMVGKVITGLRELSNSDGDSTVNMASISVHLQTLERYINQYKQEEFTETNEKEKRNIRYVSYKMADEHQNLLNEFNELKKVKEMRNRIDNTRNELFMRSDGSRLKFSSSNNYRGSRVEEIEEEEEGFYDRSEIAIDGFIDQGVAALDNLRQQRNMLGRANKNVHASRNTLDLSGSVIRFINRRNAQDKLIMIAGMVVTVIFVYFVIKYLS
ncbi:hypothetical protein BB559_002546 [Furculomyces boomerangus]|uniref:Protein transport protein BOS1 n=2 Tax=Harpellales TaxID=61421 RepID=A0A2T9YUE0_9FUNG|nr:hypothetical protein BB559_002546 [Furculomyces boomerangus]PWA01315.1 hypothetical protein BB558_002594 [Smittium angustum]